MRRALIVDDDPPFRRFLHAVLTSDGYETMTAADGRAGLDLFKRHGPFDVVLTDVMMPLMGGSQLGRYLRQITPDIKVLYVTGSRDALFSDKTRLSPGEAVLEKPCSPAHIIDAVRGLVNACETDSSR